MSKDDNINEWSPTILGAIGWRLFETFLTLLKKIHYIGVPWIFMHYLYKIIVVVAGKETVADITADLTLNGVVDGKISIDQLNPLITGTFFVLISVIVLLSIVIYYKSISLNDYKRKSGELEAAQVGALDSNRGSSNLTNTGNTNPEDLP